MNTQTDSKTGEGNAPRVNWAAMSDRQLEYQADCFELHGERLPKELRRELDKRSRENPEDPMGSARLMQQMERIAGA